MAAQQRQRPRGAPRRAAAASSGSSAIRNRGRPCWRVPRISPSPRRVRSTSASSKPSRGRARSPPSAGRRALGVGVGEQDAVALVLAAADATAQLVKLGEPVALGALDQHHGGVGDVDADLDHGGRDEHVELAAGESLHRLGLLARRTSGRAAGRRGSRRARRRASRSASALAAFACSFSESETSGQTTNAWRPSRRRARMNSYAPARFSSPTTQVFTGRRPAGSSRIVVVSRSPYAVSESVRGIGVAVMCRTWGAASPGPLASSAARCATPKRCCSSTTQTARLAKRDVGLDQRVGADDEPQLARGRAGRAPRAAAPRGSRR